MQQPASARQAPPQRHSDAGCTTCIAEPTKKPGMTLRFQRAIGNGRWRARCGGGQSLTLASDVDYVQYFHLHVIMEIHVCNKFIAGSGIKNQSHYILLMSSVQIFICKQFSGDNPECCMFGAPYYLTFVTRSKFEQTIFKALSFVQGSLIAMLIRSFHLGLY